MADWNYRISPNITLGTYAVTKLGQIAKEFGNRFMLMLDPVFKEFGLYDKITASLGERGIDFFVFDEVSSFPSSSVIQRALDLAKKSQAQGVIASGGSKVLIAAKCVCAIFNEEKTISDFFDGQSITKPALPLIAIPSVPKDSFVFMNKMPVIDARTRQLMILTTQNAICKAAIFDPNLSTTLSKKQTLSFCLEIFCMAIESSLSSKASFFSDMLCDKALEIFSQMTKAKQKDELPDEEELLKCGCLSSLAVATTGIGTASLLALSINARFGLSRSLVCAILLPYMIERANDFSKEKIEHIKSILQIETELADDARQRLALYDLPSRLKDLSLTMEQISTATQDAMSLEFASCLPFGISKDDLFELAKKAF